ncbi:MAG: transmembrane 220 family protein [Bacteroidota bacterium]
MTAAFLFSVAVQYNDPDPIQWMAIYGFAAAACILSLKDTLNWKFSATVALAALVWACLIAPAVLSRPFPTTIVDSFHMTDVAVEEARELGGLLIVLGWMVVLSLAAWRKPRVYD